MKQFFFAFMAFFAFGQLNAQQLRGKVVDAYTQNPIESALISFNNQAITATDKDGNFTIDCVTGVLSIDRMSYAPIDIEVKGCDNVLRISLTPVSENLNTVDVSADRIQTTINLEQARSIGIVNRPDLERETGLFIEESMNLLSGVRVEKRTMSGGQRITIRGYGNNQRFNGYGFRAYLNDIPVTDAEGVTTMDDIDPSLLGQIQVIKGPMSSQFGNGIAGAVLMQTLKPTVRGTRLVQEGLAGSYGLWRTNTRVEHSDDKASILLNYGHQNYDSYRVHNSAVKDFLTFSGDFNVSDKRSINVYAAYNKSHELLAGQLDSAQFFNRENVAETPYFNNDGHVDFEGYRVGVGQTYKFNRQFANTTTLFVSSLDQDQAYAAGLNRNSTQNAGLRSVFRWNSANEKISGSIGIEYQSNRSFRKTYRMSNLVISAMSTDIEFAAANAMAFTEWDYHFAPSWTLTAGVSATSVSYDITDRLNYIANHSDGSGAMTFGPAVMPRISLNKTWNDKVSTFVHFSQGFSAPTSSNIVIGYTGEVNKDLKPEYGTQLEVGTKGTVLNDRLSYQLSVYQLRVSNKLNTKAVVDDTTGTVLYSYSVNSGAQNNLGLELDLSYIAYKNDRGVVRQVRPWMSYTYSNYTYEDFKSDDNNNAATVDYSGNQASGIAPHLFNIGFDLNWAAGFYTTANYRYVDQMPITFDNEHFAPSYGLLNAKAGWKKSLNNWDLEVYAGANNITNELYYTMVVLNQPFSASSPKVFLPGPYTATFYGGARVAYRF